jgi:hypothetical protein
VVKQALEKLRVATDWQADPARIEREAVGLRLLEQFAPAGSITRSERLNKYNGLLEIEAETRLPRGGVAVIA